MNQKKQNKTTKIIIILGVVLVATLVMKSIFSKRQTQPTVVEQPNGSQSTSLQSEKKYSPEIEAQIVRTDLLLDLLYRVSRYEDLLREAKYLDSLRPSARTKFFIAQAELWMKFPRKPGEADLHIKEMEKYANRLEEIYKNYSSLKYIKLNWSKLKLDHSCTEIVVIDHNFSLPKTCNIVDMMYYVELDHVELEALANLGWIWVGVFKIYKEGKLNNDLSKLFKDEDSPAWKIPSEEYRQHPILGLTVKYDMPMSRLKDAVVQAKAELYWITSHLEYVTGWPNLYYNASNRFYKYPIREQGEAIGRFHE